MALVHAADGGHEEIVEMLLAADGIDVNITDEVTRVPQATIASGIVDSHS